MEFEIEYDVILEDGQVIRYKEEGTNIIIGDLEFSHQVDFEKHGAEYYDVLIRCYLVGEILNDVINELM